MTNPAFLNPDVPLNGNKPLPHNFREFAKYVWRKNPGLWALFFVQDIVHFLRYPLSFIIVGKIIDTLKGANPADGIPHKVFLLLGAMASVLFIGELAHVWTAHIIIHWKPKLRAAIRSDFLNYTMGHGHAYFQDNFAGALARKISEVSESALRLHDVIRFQIWFAMIQMTTAFSYMFLVNPFYGLALLCFIATVTLPIVLRLPTIRKRSLSFSDQRAHITGMVVDMLGNISAVKSYSALGHETGVHAGASDLEKERASKVIRTMVQIEDFRRLCLVILGGGMTTMACVGWAHGWITVGQASSIATITMMLTGTTWMLGSGIVQFVDEAGYISDALRITARPHDILDAPNAAPLLVQGGAIDYRDVDFAFGNRAVFSRLNLNIGAGEKIALVGPSGAGKSTFVSLLLRLYDLQGGHIVVDGQFIDQVSQDSLRRAIAVIPQDTALFHRSLMDNIRYGRLDATDEEVVEASRRAHAHEFIASLPAGYETLVGERGIRLSGGQRQRIAIARAILKNAPILVLDEATSALDSESERLIQQALADLMAGKTVIAIAHRLSTIARMDRIIVFDRGQIVEQGPHERLVRSGGLYSRLWSMQSGGFLHEEGLGKAGA
ncbi:MAG TPA: ABC transporter ATP-binding protein [Patescibacteria group bacterium]|nr:ABC transporter ATP-binding protein [Patescibacteria group bacterium]